MGDAKQKQELQKGYVDALQQTLCRGALKTLSVLQQRCP
jgi:hypothetical protein